MYIYIYIYTTRYKIQKLSFLPTQCMCASCNNQRFPNRAVIGWIYNPDVVCLLWGRKLTFKHNSRYVNYSETEQ